VSSILHIADATAATVPDSDIDIEFVQSNFADIARMQAMWIDSDPDIRVASRSICVLLARCLLRRAFLDESEPHWLQDVTGNPSNAISGSDIATRDHMNLEAFVYGDLAAEHTNFFHRNTRDSHGCGNPDVIREFREALEWNPRYRSPGQFFGDWHDPES
jgi:hypothetical protein